MKALKAIVVVFILVAAAAGVGYGIRWRFRQEEGHKQVTIEEIRKKEGIPVRVGPPLRATLRSYLRLHGTVAPDREVVIRSKIMERIIEPSPGKCDYRVPPELGDRVAKGQVLVLLDGREAEANLAVVEADVDLARKDFERSKKLLAEGGTTGERHDQMKSRMDRAQARLLLALIQLANTKIVSPITGFCTRRMIEPGELATVGAPLLRITSVEKLKVEVEVPQSVFGQVRVGQWAELDGLHLSGGEDGLRVSEIIPRAETASRIAMARIPLANPCREDGSFALQPGMYVRVSLLRAEAADALAVRQDLVRGGPEGAFVLVEENGVARRIPVVPGLMADGLIEIREGLEPDARVIQAASNLLRDGVRVKIVEEREDAEGQAPAAVPRRPPGSQR